MPLTKQQRREPEGHDHPTDRVESIDFSAAMGSAEGAMAAKPSGSAKQARATDEQRREPEARDHRNYRVESIDFSVAIVSTGGTMTAKPPKNAKQFRATDEAAAS